MNKSIQGKNMIDISFVVICYNQEKIIAETLESIKYQLETYQTDDKVQLIIADDASKDRTTQIIEKWLAKNGFLFTEVCTLFAEKNQGTSNNLLGAVRKATGKYLLTIAGDDLFSNVDVIKICKKNPSNGIIACAPYCFEDKSIITNVDYYRDTIASYFFSADYVKKRAKYACPVVNGAIVGRDFFCEEAMIFSKKVKVLDDQARFMKAMELVENMIYSYLTQPIMLYRISSMQVTRNPAHMEQVIEDKKQLTEYAGKHTSNLLIRYAIFCEYMRLKNRKLYKIVLRFFNLDNYYVKIICWRHRKEIKRILDNLLQPENVYDMNQYICLIHENAKKYLEN